MFAGCLWSAIWLLDLECESHSIEKNANTLWKSNTIIWKVPIGVFEMKTFESDTKSVIGLGPPKQAVEKHKSDLFAFIERNVDLKGFFPAEIVGDECRLLVMELKRLVFNELHEDLEHVKCLKIVKDIKGNMGIRTMLNVWKSLRMTSLKLEKWVNVNSTS